MYGPHLWRITNQPYLQVTLRRHDRRPAAGGIGRPFCQHAALRGELQSKAQIKSSFLKLLP